MEGLLSVLQGVSSAESNYFNIYVDGLDDQVFGMQTDQLHEVVQNISSLLSKSTSRLLGLRLLNKFLDQCNADVFNKTGNLWTSLALKACHAQMQPNEASLAYEALGKIASKSLQSPDLTKSFSTGHLAKVYESLNYVPIANVVSALRCVEICLRLYPASSGPSRKTIEKFLARFHDTLDADIVLYNGKCLHLMQQVSGGEIRSSSHKTQWKTYQTQLVGSIHEIFDVMFANCNEIWDDNVVQEHFNMEKIELSDEPVNRAAQLYIRYHNLVQYLIVALKEPFPTEKPILPKMLLSIINRGLSVTCNILNQNPITDNIALALLIPKVHIDLLHLLDAMTSILRGHILPYYNLILGLLMDIMKSTSTDDSNGSQKPFALLRAKIYESISLWCKIQSSGSRCDAIAEHLINEILADITPEQNELTLQVCAGAGKHMSKKMKRQLHKAQNERSKISKTAVKVAKNFLPQKEDRNQMVCIAALRCLQEILLSVASFLKPTKIKLLQTTLVQICGNFYELALDVGHLYSSAQCRLEIYNLLCVIVSTPHHLSPPPMDLILVLLNNGCSRDGNVKVRTHCGRILQNLEKLLHPQKESLVFPVDGRDVRNAFIMLGQERLLDESAAATLNNDESDDELLEEGNAEEANNVTINHINEKDAYVDEQNDTNVKTTNVEDDSVEVEEDVEQINTSDVQIVEQINESGVQMMEQGNENDGQKVELDNSKMESSVTENVEDSEILKASDHLQDSQKSPDIVLRVEEDCDSPVIAQHVGGDTNKICDTQTIDQPAEDASNDEPSPKKARVDETSEGGELDDSFDMDDDKLLEDIAASFVDDLA